MSKIYVNEIQTLDAGSVTFATGTNVILNGSITVGGEINGTLSSSAISNITSLGTLTSLDVSGDIAVGGTVDGVDLASFKTAYDSHSHGDLYYTETEVDTLLTNSANWDTAYGWGDHAGLYSLLGHTHTESEVTDFGNYITDVTHDTVNTKLVVTKRDATTTDLSLTQYLDDTNLARLVSGSINASTGIGTFTRDDATTFDVDFSSLLDDTNDYVSSASFNSGDGVLTLTRFGGTNVTVDLDGRYLTDIGVSVISGNTTAVKNTLYVFTANLTLTLPASPSVGDTIKFSNLSGTTTPVIARNGNNIMGLAENLTVDVENFGGELIYSGATKGWVLI